MDQLRARAVMSLLVGIDSRPAAQLFVLTAAAAALWGAPPRSRPKAAH